MKKKIVISAINIHYGGTLSIVKAALSWLSEHVAAEYDIIALVHNKDLYTYSNITYVEFPDSRRSWVKRLQYEYWHFRKLSRELQPYLWFSLHDTSPVVEADIQAVYCHNPGPYYQVSRKEAKQDKVFAAFTWFYKYLYQINIHANTYVVVQQDWIRNYFVKTFNLPQEKVVVAYPDTNPAPKAIPELSSAAETKTMFFYPSFPRVFKNFELIGQAVQLLHDKGIHNFKVVLTADGSENAYAHDIKKVYAHLPQINWIGALTREQVDSYYIQSDCLIFPSKLETWGLPITEYKPHQKPMLLARLPYAKETVGSYEQVSFFDPHNAAELAGLMEQVIERKIAFEGNQAPAIAQPFTTNWSELFHLLLSKR
ncbi:glycosyltransferase [Pontibacter amylolyticus]|uniref:Glycosyl transferase family 1 domain-containing protein n=1 Tax=Pontibacter amylolyticus TaxID=1424080 RepID=A0ABQ1WES2_9BACT|nr:glycosyltransferase [Pontibacter amylolyticus]GGG27069.1 hypothetical protein GCM10011323_33240 [Pontibacter amylolyticus]